jgi:hypothetical protein
MLARSLRPKASSIYRRDIAQRVWRRNTPPNDREDILKRFLGFLKLVFGFTVLMFGAWLISATFFPEGFLRPYFSRLFSARVGELTFWRVFLANLLTPFLGIQFMNFFRVRRYAGGIYVLPVFWVLYGLLLGTNSFVFASRPIPFSISVLWTRTGLLNSLPIQWVTKPHENGRSGNSKDCGK